MTYPPLRIVFAGTPDFAADHLTSLIADKHHIVAVYTQPDRPAGRGKKILPTPVKAVAQTHDIAVFQPARLTDEDIAKLAALEPDVMVVVAYGLILPASVLQVPRFGCINVHASLLPRWRGAAPIERAILAGDSDTGISIMQMDVGLDTGDVLLMLNTAITDADNALTITEKLTRLGCQGLSHVLADIHSFQNKGRQQNDANTTYAAKLGKEEAIIHWHQPAQSIQRQVQAFYPRSPAWCHFRGDRLRIIEAVTTTRSAQAAPGTITANSQDSMTVACGEQALHITRIQLPGKKAMAMTEVLNGYGGLFAPGTSLTDDSSA